MSNHLIVPLIHPLPADRHGSKAARLAQVAALGAKVPTSVVIRTDAHELALGRSADTVDPRSVPGLVSTLSEGLGALGNPPWVVRTSAPAEDLPGASAAGLYRSELGLERPDDVVAAVQRCWLAAGADRVRIYLTATGQDPSQRPSVAILIQQQVRAAWAGVLFTRDPREGPQSDQLRCELARASTTAVTAGLVDPDAYLLDRHGRCSPPLPSTASVTADALLALADLAETTANGPADVELALTDQGPVVLQVRPITAYANATGRAPAATSPDDDLPWRWDAAHNPDPLSPLHASLVARLDGIPTLPFRLRCIGGYLHFAPRPGVATPPDESPEQIQHAWPQRRRQLERLLEPLERSMKLGADVSDVSLAAALTAFDEFYNQYAALAGAPLAGSHRRFAARVDEELSRGTITRAQLSQALGGVRTPLTEALRTLGRHIAAHPHLLPELTRGREVSALPGGAAFEQDLAAVIAALGALPPAWDLAVPTLGESPTALRRTVAALAGQPSPAQGTPAGVDDPHLQNLAADEEDDLLFARGLAALRSLCLQAGQQLVRATWLDEPDQVFRLTLPPLLAALDNGADAGPRLRALLTPDPEQHEIPEPSGVQGPMRGFGTGAGVVRARALVITRLTADLEALVPAARGRIVVCATLVPAAVVLLAHASAIVTDHGGLLSHGAILARELGLPAVLGTRTATGQIATDDLLWLDADQGLVIKM